MMDWRVSLEVVAGPVLLPTIGVEEAAEDVMQPLLEVLSAIRVRSRQLLSGPTCRPNQSREFPIS